jgi:cell wall-associated NlpC family hydrolase
LEDGGGQAQGAAVAPARIGRAPWGARLPAPVDKLTILPDGRRASIACGSGGASPADGRLLAPAARADRFPRDPAAAARTAVTWLGTPYVWGGRIRSGTDCSGLVQSVFGLHGIDVPRDSRQQAEAGGAPVEAGWEQALPGDLLFFAWDGPVSHVGICLGNGAMVHSSETQGGVAVDELGSGAFGRRLANGYAGAVRPA